MIELLIEKLSEPISAIVLSGAGAFLGAYIATHFGYKKSHDEALGAQVAERRVQLYDDLLNASFRIRLNRKKLFDDSYLTRLYCLTPRCRALAKEEVRAKFEDFFNYLVTLRTEYATKDAELESQFYCHVPACDYYNTEDTEEVCVPQCPGSEREYGRQHRSLQESLLPNYKKLDELLNGLSNAIYSDLNRG